MANRQIDDNLRAYFAFSGWRGRTCLGIADHGFSRLENLTDS